MTIGQPRQSAGIPQGGQYAEHNRSEAIVELVPEDSFEDWRDRPQTFRIPEARLTSALLRIEKANRRLERAGMDERFTPEMNEVVVEDAKTGIAHAFVDLTLERPRLSLGGWAFAGVFDSTANGTIIPAYRADNEVPFPADMHCDQCGAIRHRDRIYMLRHDDGSTKQVGKSCLAVNTGVTPAGLWALTSDLDMDNLEEDDPEAATDRWGARTDQLFEAHDLIAVAYKLSDGGLNYVSRSAATMDDMATADLVRKDWDSVREALSGDDVAGAQKVIEWLSEQTAEPGSYIDNVRASVGVNTAGPTGPLWVRAKQMSIAASAVSAYRRDQERQLRGEAEAKTAKMFAKGYVAPEGEKIADVPAQVLRTMHRASDFGATTMVELVTDDGHIITWWASGHKTFEPGARTLVKGTVKAHETYRDVDQTVITRAKITDPESGEVLGVAE